MTTSATIIDALSTHGVTLLAPLAVIEGPIVSIIAGYLASRAILPLATVIIIVILADLLGDCLLYAFGRGALNALPAGPHFRPLIHPCKIAALAARFRANGFRFLVIGKLTHAAGFAVLIAAGASRMPFLPFLAANLLASIPKSLAFVTLGYLFGSAHEAISGWISFGSAALFALVAVAAIGFYLSPKRLSA